MSVNFNEITKGDIVNGAYSRLRISGITTNPTVEDMTTALMRLEVMAHEFNSRNMAANFNFTQFPEPGDQAGIEMFAIEAYECNLAMRVASDFGEKFTSNPLLMQQATQSASNLANRTARVRQTLYPERQPRGSGVTLRYFPWSQYNRKGDRAPLNSAILRLGEVNDFIENFSSFLEESETITNHTIDPDNGITVISSSVDGEEIRFRLRLDRISSGEDDNIEGAGNGLTATKVEIEITTSTGRVKRVDFFIDTRR